MKIKNIEVDLELKLEKKFNKFIDLILENEFFKAHEILEEIWFPIRKDKNSIKVKILKAFINSAVSFELIKRGRLSASKVPWSNYKKYISTLKDIDDKEKLEFYLKIVKTIESKNLQMQNYSNFISSSN